MKLPLVNMTMVERSQFGMMDGQAGDQTPLQSTSRMSPILGTSTNW